MAGSDFLHMVGFLVGGEKFCINILKVQEIIRVVDITNIPNSPKYVEGIINLRGRIIPILDFRKRCNLCVDTEFARQDKRIVVTAIGEKTVGLIVDKVSQVLKIEREDIEVTPEIVKGFNTDFISGIGKDGDRLLILLDLEKLISRDELNELEQVA